MPRSNTATHLKTQLSVLSVYTLAGMDTRNAQTRVCNITELVEEILLQADQSPLDLLLARRINKTFNDVILHALPFRRALFLEPDDTFTESETDPANVEVNPFFEKIFTANARAYFDRVLGRTEGHDVLVGLGKVCKRCYSKRINLASLEDDRCYLQLPLLETRDVEDYFTPAQWHEHALWRNMYATRPILPIHVVDTTPIAHRWQIAPKTTLGDIVPVLVVGHVSFSATESQLEDL
jgi:hypothetical protein